MTNTTSCIASYLVTSQYEFKPAINIIDSVLGTGLRDKMYWTPVAKGSSLGHINTTDSCLDADSAECKNRDKKEHLCSD